jgi:phosphohistidine phosphatase
MVHRLLLLRHAKSDWGDVALADRDRPLAGRGRRAASRIGAHLKVEGLGPDLVLCSSARRTQETLGRLGLGDAETSVEDDLYGAPGDALLARIRGLPETVGTALLIGHNPGVQDLAIALAGPDLGEPAVRLREKFPTAALAVFEVQGGWSEFAPGRARLTSFVVPRELET